MEATNSARVHDSVGHTYKKAAIIVGAEVGIVVGIACLFIPGVDEAEVEGGLSILEAGEEAAEVAEEAEEAEEGILTLENAEKASDINDWSQIGAWLGKKVLSYLPKDPHCGKITKGASRTWTEGELNARITDPCECKDPAGTPELIGAVLFPVGLVAGVAYDALGLSAHSGAKVAEGSKTVFIEGKNASRQSEHTSCGGYISEGAKKTFVGGPSVVLAGCEDADEEGDFVKGAFKVLGTVGDILGLLHKDPLDIALGATKFLLGLGADYGPEELKPSFESGKKKVEDVINAKTVGGSLDPKKKLIKIGGLWAAKTIKSWIGDEANEEPVKRDVVTYPD